MIKTTLGIEGMMCGMCESHINNAIRNNFKVKKVNSSKNNGQTEIISEELLDKNKLIKVIEETGYTLTSVNVEEYKNKFSLFGR